MRKLNFDEKNILVRKAIGHLVAINITSSNVNVIDVIDTRNDIRVYLKIDNYIFSRILWKGLDYNPLSEFNQQEIDNRIIDLI